MSISLKRFQAAESDFTQTGRLRAKVTVPGLVGFTDLAHSKVVFEMTPTVESGGNAMPWPVTFTQPTGRSNADFAPKQAMVGAQALIKNTRVVSREYGLLNEQRHQNVISSNLDWYLKSRDEEDQSDVFGNTISGNYGRRSNFVADSPFYTTTVPTVVGTAVTNPAVLHEASIPIDWKHIDQFAQIEQFPNIMVGDIDYHIEFEDQIDVIQLAESPINVITITNANSGAAGEMPALITDRTRSQIVHPILEGEQVFIRFMEGGNLRQSFVKVASVATNGNNLLFTVTPSIAGLGNASACTGIAIYYGPRIRAGLGPFNASNVAAVAANGWVGSAANPLVFPAFYGADVANTNPIDYSKCPFAVGQYICMHYVQANNASTHEYVLVEQLNVIAGVNAPVGLQVITSEPAPNTFTVDAVSSIQVSIPDHDGGGDPFTCSWTVNDVYAQMNVLNLMPQQQQDIRRAIQAGVQIPWMEQRLMQKSISEASTVTATLELLPNTVGLAILTPRTLELVSTFDGCTSYRIALDGNEVTNRDIVCGMWTTNRSIHNYLLKQYYANIGSSLKKYDASWMSRAAVGYIYAGAAISELDVNTHSFFPLVVPKKQDYTQLQIQLFTGGAGTMSDKSVFYVSTIERVLQFKDGRVSVF
jgi:hypothetical protein